ncbi:hypothetical protein [Microcoleus sp. FACHB-672]|uniref:hypothetical protein n=1 Tax=Microcoleus sp. FACHB-672 TaxID=2692825 RepID=UPI001687FF70|nr:hypothetical protein [Microcoleus sp. FACHB-672]MBD2041658.1 hypothetical protein [Microcoleus sp. FACHB-672]
MGRCKEIERAGVACGRLSANFVRDYRLEHCGETGMNINQQNQPSSDNNSRDAGDNRPSCIAPLQRARLFHSSLSHAIFLSALQKALLLAGCLLMACQSPAGAESWNFSDVPTPQLLAQVPRQYLVYVKGESDQMLEQVRRVAPEAYIDQFKGRKVINAGTFYDRELAKRREQEIESLYIRAEVARIEGRYNPSRAAGYSTGSSRIGGRYSPSTATYSTNSSRIGGRYNPSTATYSTNLSRIGGRYNPSTATYSTRPSVVSRGITDNDYFVVIPASAQDLTAIAEQVRLLGAPAEGVEDRDQPRGYHIAVGPFSDRSTAERWNRYLTDLGLGNARVYYGR